MAGVIPAGNMGQDPWSMLRDYVRNQNTQQLQRENLNARADMAAQAQQAAMDRAQYTNSAAVQYAKTDARLKARIANGFGPRTGSGSAMTDKKAAAEFEAGLREGGLNNPYAVALMMGNAQSESKFNPNATGDLTLGPGREAHGMMQWREERWKALQDFAAAKGVPVNDPKTQGMYAAYEVTQGLRKQLGPKLNSLKSMDGGQDLMYQYLGYNKKVANEADRFATSQAWLKKDQGIKSQVADATASRHYRDPSDPAFIYRESDKPDAARYQLTHMTDSAYQTALAGMRRQYKKDADKMIVRDFNEPVNPKTGAFTYRVYDRPPSLLSTEAFGPPMPASMVPAKPTQVAAEEPETTGSVAPLGPLPEEIEEDAAPPENPLDYVGD